MRIALFGGTFDPVHQAHLTVAKEAAVAFSLDQVLFVPAAHPPHKTGSASYEDRYQMVKLACAGEPLFQPSRLEEGREQSYSIRTVERIRSLLSPSDHLFFIIGADAFAEIESWHRWREVTAAVEFIVVTRPGHRYQTPPGARVQRLDTVALPISSSEIRYQITTGQVPSELPAKVYQYIRSKGLYCQPQTGG